MHTVILQNRPRKGSSGNTWSIEVLGAESSVKDAVKASIRELEHHPAKAPRRSIIDMLSLIEKHNFQIKFTEHYFTDDELEGWTFILQG